VQARKNRTARKWRFRMSSAFKSPIGVGKAVLQL
jgi:hypothetical protein